MTRRLFDEDSHMCEFDAEVISCEPSGDNVFRITLDCTAFFPEGGGQSADTGSIGGIPVFDVHEKNGIIYHNVNTRLEPGSIVHGSLDWKKRFRRMQNHSGEHIVSGIIFREYKLVNLGFHMGIRDVTIDINGVLERDDLRRIEYLANQAVAENVRVTAEYPSGDELRTLVYRSKIDLTEGVRIVTFDGYDKCACCAPHVNRSGEIGMIKLLDYMHYKGGVRIHMLCGFDALDDYNMKYDNISKIAASLSVKQHDTAAAVSRLSDSVAAAKQESLEFKRELIRLKLANIEDSEENIVLFEPLLDMDGIRTLAEGAAAHCAGVCAVFSGDDRVGYKYAAASKTVDMRIVSKIISSGLNGRGGGSREMIQGSVSCAADEIEAFFREARFDC